MVQWPSASLLEMVVIGVFALSVNVKTHMEIIPITAAAIFEAVDILNTVESLNSSCRGTLSRFRNLTSDICGYISSLCGKTSHTIMRRGSKSIGYGTVVIRHAVGGMHCAWHRAPAAFTLQPLTDYSPVQRGNFILLLLQPSAGLGVTWVHQSIPGRGTHRFDAENQLILIKIEITGGESRLETREALMHLQGVFITRPGFEFWP